MNELVRQEIEDDETIMPTHGLAVKDEEEGVKRQFAVLLFDDGTYGIHLETWVDGYDKIDTKLNLTKEAFELLTSLMVEAANSIEDYPTTFEKH